MTTPNPDRGEKAITLGGKRYIIRLSMDDIRRLEERLGKGFMALSRTFGNAPLTEVLAVLTAGINGGRNKGNDGKPRVFEEIDIRRIMDEVGYIASYQAAAEIILGIIGEGNPDEGKSEPQGTT